MPYQAQKKNKKRKEEPKKENPATGEQDDLLTILLDHYASGQADMDQRRVRPKGWNEIFKAYLGILPSDWPYQSKVTDPRIRTSINEKTARLLNAKLRGHLVPREGGDQIGARINNALLTFQWDVATLGGTMLEKVAKSDSIARLVGAAFHFNYWDAEKNSNESKPCDPRDMLFSGDGDHVHNSRWVQYREYVAVSDLKTRGYDLSGIEFGAGQTRESRYDSIVKTSRGLEDRVGMDKSDPVVELITEWKPKWATEDRLGRRTVFLPHYKAILEDGPNPYKHGLVPFSQLRYYPVHDDIYGESEVEPVLPLQRAINAILCGYLDEMNLVTRPPIKVMSGAARLDTIVYGPGAVWIVNRPDAVEEVQMGGSSIAAFNNTYPSLIAAFNNAMGDQSLGVSNQVAGGFTDKTATEVRSNEKQALTRDQYNQLYLGEFLKDIMQQWLANNEQFLLDDETKHVHVLRIVGKEKVKELEQLGLAADAEVPTDTIKEMAGIIEQSDGPVDIDAMLEQIKMPQNAVLMNPEETDPDRMEIRPKLKMLGNNEAELAVTKEDLGGAGTYDYIPDVKSMAAGATQEQQLARKQALDVAMNKDIEAKLLQEKQPKRMKFSEILTNVLEDAGFPDAESLFEDVNVQAEQQAGAGILPPGAGAIGAGQLPVGANGDAGLQPVPEAVSDPALGGGLPIA